MPLRVYERRGWMFRLKKVSRDRLSRVFATGGGPAPDQTRRQEPLEAYSLESLRMVGTLQREPALSADQDT